MISAVQRDRDRRRRWRTQGAASLARTIGQIGILGWIVVTPILLGVGLGRWLDHRFGTGIFWSAPLLMVGAAVGFWSAWQWMHRA